MQFDIVFRDEGERPDVEITLAGLAIPAEFARFEETLRSDPRFRAGLVLLVDVSELDASPLLEGGGMESLTSSVVERDWEYAPAAVAIVAAKAAIYDDARTYRAQLGGSRSHREIFHTRAEALAWLAQVG